MHACSGDALSKKNRLQITKIAQTIRRLLQDIEAEARLAVSPRLSPWSPDLQTIQQLASRGAHWSLPSPDTVPRYPIGAAAEPMFAKPDPLWDFGRRSNGEFRWRDEQAPFAIPGVDSSRRVFALDQGTPRHSMWPLDSGTPFEVASNLGEIARDKRRRNPLSFTSVNSIRRSRGDTPDSLFAEAWADALTTKVGQQLAERQGRKRDHQYPALHSASALETRRCSIGVDQPLGETVFSTSQRLAPMPQITDADDQYDEDTYLWMFEGAPGSSRVGSLTFQSPDGEALSAQVIGDIGRMDAFMTREQAVVKQEQAEERISKATADAELIVMRGNEFLAFSQVELGIERLGLSNDQSFNLSLGQDEKPLVQAHMVYSTNKVKLADAEQIYRDEHSRRINWPWEPPQPIGGVTGSKRQREGTEYCRGFHMYFNSASPADTAVAQRRFSHAQELASRSGIYRAAFHNPHHIDHLINEALNHATADGKRGAKSTGVKAWIAFCIDMGVPWIRVMDPNAPLIDKLDEEWLAMRFVAALVEERGVNASTAAGYFSSVQGWMAREAGIKLAGGMKLERLPQMIKGLRRMHGERHKPLRRPISPDTLRAAMDKILDPSNPLHANQRAAIATAFQGLLRSAEFTGALDKNTILRSDLKKLSAEQLVLMMHPCKNMHHINGKTCPLVIGGGGMYIDACAEMLNLLQVDDTRGHGEDVPLFRDPTTNKPLSYQSMERLIKQIYQAAGLPLDQCGTHILRISGATALFAAGGSDTIVRTMGRWSSDLYRLYVRACFEQCTSWSAKAGSTAFSPTAVVYDEVDDY